MTSNYEKYDSDPTWINAKDLEAMVVDSDEINDTNKISCKPVQSYPSSASPLSPIALTQHNSPLTRSATTSPRQNNPQVQSPLTPPHQLSSSDDATTEGRLSPAVPPPLFVSHLQTPPPSVQTPDIRGKYCPGSNDLSCEQMAKGWLNSNEEKHQFSKRFHYNAEVDARRTLQARALSLA